MDDLTRFDRIWLHFPNPHRFGRWAATGTGGGRQRRRNDETTDRPGHAGRCLAESPTGERCVWIRGLEIAKMLEAMTPKNQIGVFWCFGALFQESDPLASGVQ